MAVDTDEVYMTTKLAGSKTFFLPFNKGNKDGQGNPLNPNGPRSSYLWEEVFAKDSLINIIQHFMRLDGSTKTPLKERNLFFPRYHQLDVVRRLIADVSKNGVGKTYLIQHSAGSGKSNSITWAAFQLIEAYPATDSLPGARGVETPLFDSVIVVTDRRLLDKQLRENIKQFSEVGNIVAPAKNSGELKSAMESGKRIIITTIQKFPRIVESIADLSDKRFAVIIDEAHSSQSGSAADNMNVAMGQKPAHEKDDNPETIQDKIIAAMQARKMRGNASYFAFTATPKNSTLEKFGLKTPDGEFKPFHLYSMKQAIEEGFILDVLSNYTTYKSYYQIRKSVEDNPRFDSAKAQKRLKAYVEKNPTTIHAKAEIMLDHFMNHVVMPKKLRGKARGMIVTQSIESAIRYYQAINQLLDQRGNPFKAIIAFSGEKTLDGISYSETEMNGFPDDKTKEYFNGVSEDGKAILYKGAPIENTYRLLIVANKYLTGFDQPKLCAMYVDKKLQHVLAVQALSRLNRSAVKLGKKREDLFVLDFFNDVSDIKSAFDPFYTATSLSSATDVNILHDLKIELDEVGVYEWLEAKEFTERYFKNEEMNKLKPFIDIAVLRFESDLDLPEEAKIDFKIKAKQFVKIYGQMAAILDFEEIEWEILFWYLKNLIPKLHIRDSDADIFDGILESVDLSSYGLSREKLWHSIILDDQETELDPQNPNPRSAHGAEREEDSLENIIKLFNEKWHQNWAQTPEDQRIIFLNLAETFRAHPSFDDKYKNNKDIYNREIAFDKIYEETKLDMLDSHPALYQKLRNDDAFDSAFKDSLKQILQNYIQ